MSDARPTSIRIFLAAGVLVGGSANGRITWKDEQGRTLKALQEERAREAQ